MLGGISIPVTDGWETLLNCLKNNNRKYLKYLCLYGFYVAISHHTAVLLREITAVGIFLSVFSQGLSVSPMSRMDVLHSPTLPSQQLSQTSWLLLCFKISQIRRVPICKLEFSLLSELTGVAAFMLGQRCRAGAWECGAGPLLSGQTHRVRMGGVFTHCKFAPACSEALSSQALLRFKHAFFAVFFLEFFDSLGYKNLVEESGLDSSWHQKKNQPRTVDFFFFFSFIQYLPPVLFFWS